MSAINNPLQQARKPAGWMSLEDALKQNREKVVENLKSYLNASLAMMLGLLNFDKQFVKAEGIHVWDSQGNR